MKTGILGFPQTGKKTLFKLLTGMDLFSTHHDAKKPVTAVAEIKDGRFDALVKMYKPKKEARAKINAVLFPDVEKETFTKSELLQELAGTDALCHVVRVFESDTVYHAQGSVEPKRDVDMVNSEFVLQDLMFIEKRLERMERDKDKTKDKAQMQHEKELLLKLKAHLDMELPLRLLLLTKDEQKLISSYPFFTRKDLIVVLNVSETALKDETLLKNFEAQYKERGIHFVQICAKAESEIYDLESEEERDEFMKELGIKESALNLLTKTYLQTLGLISFFTVGEDEVRQWCIHAGENAQEAAGTIHSDLQKGFIRAEIMKYDELLAAGSEEKLQHAGKLYLKGKDYVVEDGDIMNVRFNV